MAKMKQWCSKIYYQTPKNGLIFLWGTNEGVARDLGVRWKIRR